MDHREFVCCAWTVLLATAAAGCASSVVATQDRSVRDALELAVWRPATAADVLGQWRVRSLTGQAAAVLLDLSYFLAEDGQFSGSALFAGPPAHYEVLSGSWSLGADGALQLGEDAEAARAEAAEGLLRLCGAEGCLVFERPTIQ